MRVLNSTRPLSPFHLYRGVVDQSVNIFGSAAGMSCLAEMPDAAFERIAAHTEGDAKWGLIRFRLKVAQYRRHLEATRKRGYGQRLEHRDVGNKVFDDGLAAIATPIRRNGGVYGAVSLLWPKAYLAPEAIAREFLESLTRTTKRISEELEALDLAAAGVAVGANP